MNLKVLALITVFGISSACSSAKDTSQLISEAKMAIDQGDLRTATIQLKSAIQQEPRNPQPRWLLSGLYYATGDLLSAEKELERAEQLGTEPDLVTPMRAKLLQQLGRPEELLNLPEDDLSASSLATLLAAKSLAGYASLGEAYSASQIKKALSLDAQQAYVRIVKVRLSLVKGDSTAPVKELESILQQEPENYDAWSILGDLAAMEGRLDDALVAYEKAVAIGTFELSDRVKRADILIRQGRYEDAQKDIDRLLKAAATNSKVNLLQGVLYFQQGQYSAALPFLHVAEQDKHELPRVLLYIGISQYTQSMIEQAGINLQEFLSLEPSNMVARQFLAAIRLSEKKYGDTEELIRPVVKALPDRSGPKNILANALLAQGEIEEALNLLESVIEMNPESPDAASRLGAALMASGEMDAGLRQLDSAIQLNPEYQQADLLKVVGNLRNDNFASAESAAKDYQQRNPGSPTPYAVLGQLYLESEQELKAEEAFSQAMQLDPGNITAGSGLAVLAIKKEEYDTARALYGQILEKHQDNLATQMNLARLEYIAGDPKAMETYLREAIDAHPESMAPRTALARHYRTSGQAEKVPGVFADLGDGRDLSETAQLEVAKAQILDRSFVDAKYTLEKLLNDSPQNAGALILLGQVHSELGDIDEAKTSLQQALELAPKHYQARLALARLQLESGDVTAADSNLSTLDKAFPNRAEIITLQAASKELRGNSKAAIASMEEAHKLANSTSSMVNLANLYAKHGDVTAAIALHESWISKHETDSMAKFSLAKIYVDQGMHDKAIKQYRATLPEEENNPTLLNNLAWELIDISPAEALALSEKANQLNPHNPLILDTLAMAARAEGEHEKAEQAIAEALEIRPEEPVMLYHAALIAYEKGERKRALSYLGRITDLETRTDNAGELAEAVELQRKLMDGDK